MKSKILLALATLFIVGCGGTSGTKEPEKINPIAMFQDEYDIDNYMFWDLGFKAHKLGLATVLFLDKNGYNVRDNGTAWVDAIARDNSVTVPIGVNHRTIMRATPPKAMSIPPSDSDFIPDSQRPDTVAIMCDQLTATTKKVKLVSGGHVHSIANFLDETDLCNGRQLMAEKVSHVIATVGRFGGVEMNFSQGVNTPTDTARAAITLLAKLPNEVKLVLSDVPSHRAVGDLYRGTGTAMEHLLGVEVYGKTYETVGQGDNLSLLYALYGTEYVREENVCFVSNITNGSISVRPPCGKNHFILRHDETTADIMQREFRGIIINGS